MATRPAPPGAVAGIAATLVLFAWTTIAPESAEGTAFVPLLVEMVFLGLPHGALDHLVPARMGAAWGRRPTTWALFLAGYVGIAAVALWGALSVVGGGLGLGTPALGWGRGTALLALAGVNLAGLGHAWRGWPGRAVDVGELLLSRQADARAIARGDLRGPARRRPGRVGGPLPGLDQRTDDAAPGARLV